MYSTFMIKDKGRCYIQDSSYEILFAVRRIFQIAVRGGGGESETLLEGIFLSGGRNLRRSDFGHLNLF